MSAHKPAVVLLSGGLDSATVLAIARERGFDAHCLSFRYGQRHAVELVAARRVATALGAASWRTVEVDIASFGGSALTVVGPATPERSIPKGRRVDEMAGDIPVTYVPARNTIFLSFALALAEVSGARDLFIGANAVDYSGYPDCRPAFIEAFEALANVATKAGVAGERWHVHAPLLHMTKADIVREGTRLGVPYETTWSCYDPVTPDQGLASSREAGAPHEALACGACDSCMLRHKGFVDAGIPDPTHYATPPSA